MKMVPNSLRQKNLTEQVSSYNEWKNIFRKKNHDFFISRGLLGKTCNFSLFLAVNSIGAPKIRGGSFFREIDKTEQL